MRIAHVTATFPPYYAGTGMVCYHNALELARRGHQVTVFTAAHPPGEYDYPQEITVVRLPVLFRFGNAPFAPGLLGIKDFDIIHLHYPFIFGAEMVWLVSRLRQIPYVLTHHNDLIGESLRRYLFDAYSKVFGRLVFGGASKFAVVSLSHAADCRMTPFFKARWKDVVEVPNGVDVERFRPGLDGTAIRHRFQISGQAKVILFVGALDRAHHFKGLGYFLRVFSRLDDPDVVLLIVGDGDLKDQFINQARYLGISERTIFAGSAPHENLPAYFAASDIVVLPSLPPESFGMVLIEAMACGKPVISHDIPGVRMVVRTGHDGFLVQPGDSEELTRRIQLLLEAPQLARKMGASGRHKVKERYAWAHIIDRLETVYQSAIEKSVGLAPPENKPASMPGSAQD
jgi:glycosyltransferase involved in cell wall biosynthesis